MGRSLSDHYVVLCEVRLVGTWIRSRYVVDEARIIRSEKLRENQYRDLYTRSFEGKRVEWDGENKVEHMAESAREMCSSVTVGGESPMSV